MKDKTYERVVGNKVMILFWKGNTRGDKKSGEWMVMGRVKGQDSEICLKKYVRRSSFELGVRWVNRFCDFIEHDILPTTK